MPTGAIEKLVENIESELYSLGKNEIAATQVGNIAMGKLADLDHIAYIRFASVYYEFPDIAVLKQAVDNLIAARQGAPLSGQLPLPGTDGRLNSRKRNRRR
jgi:transcriptional repressor NrdR